MIDFFKFRENLAEAKKRKVKEQDLEKDADDPCWDGYVQLGTKMKDGKEVPNCVPMEEAAKQVREKLKKGPDDPCQAGWVQLGMKTKNGRQVPNCVPLDEARKQMKNESASYEDDIDPNKKIVVKGTKGMNSKKFTKTFRNMKAADKWMDDNEDDIEIKQVMNESALTEAKSVEVSVRDARKANDIAKDMFRGEYKNDGSNSFVFKKADAADDFRAELKKQKVELIEQTLAESKTVDVSVRDALKANDIAQDMYRGEYKNDGSNSFVFKKADAADDFRAELKKQKVELMEAQSGDKEAYTKFFNAALKRFGADSIADMDDDKKKEFFTYVDKNWESEDEKNESF